MSAHRFAVSVSSFGAVSIVDSGSGKKETVALFFKDKGQSAKAELLAKICAKALNDESARRMQKSQADLLKN